MSKLKKNLKISCVVTGMVKDMKARKHPAFADDKQNTIDDVEYLVKLYKGYTELQRECKANLYPIFNGGVRVTYDIEVLSHAVGVELSTVEQDDWMNPYKKFFIYKDVEFYQYEWRIDLDK